VSTRRRRRRMTVRVYNRELLNEVCAAEGDTAAGLLGGHQGEDSGFTSSTTTGLFSEQSGLADQNVVHPFSNNNNNNNNNNTETDYENQGGVRSSGGFLNSAGSARSGAGGSRRKDRQGELNPSSHSSAQPVVVVGGVLADEGKSTKLQTIAANEERYRQMHEKARREAERRIQENAKRRELQFNEMFAQVQNGIDRKSGILKEVDQLVEQSDRSKDKRARALYQSWNEEVYNNIQRQIRDQLDTLTTEELETRLNEKYDAFLQASNQKAGVFMKTASLPAAGPGASKTTNGNLVGMTATSARDANNNNAGSASARPDLTRACSSIKVSTAGLKDPLKRSLLKIKEEKSIITRNEESLAQQREAAALGGGGGGGGAREQLGRECLDTTLWCEERLRHTPYGHIHKAYYDPSLGSEVHMNHFAYPKGNKVAFENFPKGKREKPDQTKNSRDTFSLIQMGDAYRTHSDLVGKGDQKGDIFLLSRGKLMLAREVQAKKGDNMFHLVGHTCKDSQPGVTGGDAWLEAKGKQRRQET